MEKRLSRFIKNRRSRLSEPLHDKPTSPGAPNPSSPSSKRPAFFTSQLRASNTSNEPVDSDLAGDYLRSFSYDSCVVGTPPTFVAKVQPGNGPVKLQASRRLSSGELIATTQEGALKDIRDGDYVVGRKERPVSRNQRKSTPRVPSVATYGLPTPTSSASPPTWSGMPVIEQTKSLLHTSREATITHPAAEPFGLDRLASTPASQSRLSRGSKTDLRNSGGPPSISRESITSYRTTSTQDGSATLAALRKAEYSRMSDLYGPEAAAINLARTSSTPSSPFLQSFSPLTESIPTFNPDNREHNPNRASRLSGNSDSCYNESSGSGSPQRTSYVSSHAGSSNATALTSFTDEECVTSREDIKSMVEQIRSTYLDAFDTHMPPPQRTKTRRKKKKTKSTSSSVPAGHESHRPELPSGRQTWHPESETPDLSFRRRVNSHPANAVGRLPPIPASPTREIRGDRGVKRADSTTLGELMADVTRTSIRAQRYPKQLDEIVAGKVPRPVTPKHHKYKESWLSMDSDVIESPAAEPLLDPSRLLVHSHIVSTIPLGGTNVDIIPPTSRDDFEELYQDLFGRDADSFWSSSSLFSEKGSSLLITHATNNNANQPHDQFSTPRKPPRITPIPESPEYTRLADPRCPEGRFI